MTSDVGLAHGKSWNFTNYIHYIKTSTGQFCWGWLRCYSSLLVVFRHSNDLICLSLPEKSFYTDNSTLNFDNFCQGFIFFARGNVRYGWRCIVEFQVRILLLDICSNTQFHSEYVFNYKSGADHRYVNKYFTQMKAY